MFTFSKQYDDSTLFSVHSVTKFKQESDPLEKQNIISLQIYGKNDEYIGFNQQSKMLCIKSQAEALMMTKFSPCRNNLNQGHLYAGDIVRLLHADTEGFLEGTINDDYFQNLKKIIQKKQGLQNFFSFQEVEQQYKFRVEKGSFNEMESRTFGCKNIFMIQKNDIFDGNIISNKEPFRLKHLASDTNFQLTKYFIKDIFSQEKKKIETKYLESDGEDLIATEGQANELFNMNAKNSKNKLKQLKCNFPKFIVENLDKNEELVFHQKGQDINYNGFITIKSTDLNQVVKIKNISDRETIGKRKYLDLIVSKVETSAEIFDFWNPLRVGDNDIDEFIFLKDFRDMITQVFEPQLKILVNILNITKVPSDIFRYRERILKIFQKTADPYQEKPRQQTQSWIVRELSSSQKENRRVLNFFHRLVKDENGNQKVELLFDQNDITFKDDNDIQQADENSLSFEEQFMKELIQQNKDEKAIKNIQSQKIGSQQEEIQFQKQNHSNNQSYQEIDQYNDNETDDNNYRSDNQSNSYTNENNSDKQSQFSHSQSGSDGHNYKVGSSDDLQQKLQEADQTVIEIAKYISNKTFIQTVARGESKSCQMFIRSLHLFKCYFLRRKKFDKNYEAIIGYDKMTKILDKFKDKFQIEAKTNYKTMTDEENMYLGQSFKSVLDFVWIIRDYQQVEYTKRKLYDKEFQFTDSVIPSKFQSLILYMVGSDPTFCHSTMKILQKDFFPVSKIYEIIQNAEITTTKGESGLDKLMNELKVKLKNSLNFKYFMFKSIIA
ncbi:MIR motif [Pseudocohnilembus persalinus]|uniref:MIR motif n=1 Tax=Pseudocohnilembus persalinus TaxID=266149 RepID=A0A0V0R4B0_PSEPJ|nr:MIR motif [Pseudocohnilembus persalinus]|eukprot:KRX09315.1 MIR motif [Pseudocohnilembus persalinus]